MGRAIEVSWIKGTAKGYTDVFPVETFQAEVNGEERFHRVRGPHGGKHQARYRLDVSGKKAELDYAAFPEFNEAQGMDLGVLSFTFADESRTQLTGIRWDGHPVGDEASWQIVEKIPIDELVSAHQIKMAQEILRPGQAEFRDQLGLAYGWKCCITGCPVPWTLQAAHILTFAGKGPDTPSNGLLLRSDWHALFDAELLAIDPQTRLVHLAAEVRAWPEYGALHKTARLSEPQPGHKTAAPPVKALEARWKKFMADSSAD